MKDANVKAIALWATLYMVLQLTVTAIHTVNPLLLSLVATFLFMFIWMMVIASVSRLQMKPIEAGLGFIVFASGILVTRRVGFDLGESFLLMFSGAFLGYLVASVIREPNILLPAAVVAGLVDYWGVYYGPTHMVLQSYPEALGTVTAAVPTAHEVGSLLRVGFGDFVFLGLFLTSVQRLHMNYRRTFILLYALLTAALVLVLSERFSSIPALVPMAMAVVVANVREFKLTRQEWLSILYVCLAFCAMVVIFLLTRR